MAGCRSRAASRIQPTVLALPGGRVDQGGVAAEAEVIVAGQIGQDRFGVGRIPPQGPVVWSCCPVAGCAAVLDRGLPSLQSACSPTGRMVVSTVEDVLSASRRSRCGLLGSILALVQPGLFTWFNGLWITLGLGLIMLGMGLGLSTDDFSGGSRPRPALVGVIAQFAVMPALAAAIAALLRLPAPLAVGLILVGCCPGGTASNVVAMIARAVWRFHGDDQPQHGRGGPHPSAHGAVSQSVRAVDGWLLLLRVLQVVSLPVAFGGVEAGMPSLASRVEPVMPPIAVVAVVMIVASVVGSQRQLLLDQGLLLLLACLLLHAGGFALGYLWPVFQENHCCPAHHQLEWACRILVWPLCWLAVVVLPAR